MFVECVIIALYVGILLLSIRISSKCERSQHVFPTKRRSLVGQTVIVTGGNSGLGYHVAEQVAIRGARVVLACRDLVKGEAARRRILEAAAAAGVVVSGVDVACKRLNVASSVSVRAFAADVRATEPRVDLLVNNAGALWLGDHATANGLQLTWQVNYFGPFLLTNLLLDKLQAAGGKVVNVTGALCAPRVAAADLNRYARHRHHYLADVVAYLLAKRALHVSSVELARRKVSVCVFAVRCNSSNFYRRVRIGLIAVFYFWLHALCPKPEVEAARLVDLIERDACIAQHDDDDDSDVYLGGEFWRATCSYVGISQ